MTKKYYSIALLVSLSSGFTHGEERIPNRISSYSLDAGKPKEIHMAPGLVTMFKFSEPVLYATSGSPRDVKAEIVDQDKRLVTATLTKGDAHPTNLIVYFGEKRPPLVFDILPKKNSHQDFVNISGSYGGPEVEGAPRTLIYSSNLEFKGKGLGGSK